MCCRIGIIPGSEVSVEGGDDCVLLSLFHITSEKSKHNTLTYTNYVMTQTLPRVLCHPPVPLSDAGSTGVCQDHTSNITKDL